MKSVTMGQTSGSTSSKTDNQKVTDLTFKRAPLHRSLKNVVLVLFQCYSKGLPGHTGDVGGRSVLVSASL